MKTLVQINSVCNGSTGKIMCGIADEAEKQEFKTYNFFGRGNPKKEGRDIKFNNKLDVYLHGIIARLGFNGHGSYFATKRLVKQLRIINPDVIHMHNIHGYYINLKVLFKYLKNEFNGKIVWTLHDCWTFTGHCSYFDFVGCDKWKTGCKNCPQLKSYPKQIFDTTRKEYKLKKELFTNLKNVTIVTPSKWLANLVKISYLKDYDVQVINNGIDTKIFRPYSQEECEEIYTKYNLPKDKKIILGVANIWEERKGLKDFIELSKVMDEEYQIVLVGIDEKTRKTLPDNIIPIQRTENQVELAKIYSLAYVFFNPTYEDNYPTVNIEAISCKTPVITYNTGGSSESSDIYGKTVSNIDVINDYKNVLDINDVKYKENIISNVQSTLKYLDLY